VRNHAVRVICARNLAAIVALVKKLHPYWAVVAWLLGFATNLSLALFVASVKLLQGYFGNKNDTAACANQHPTPIIEYAWLSQVVFLYIPWHFKIRQRVANCFMSYASSTTTKRCYDRTAYTVALFYVFLGMSTWYACRNHPRSTAPTTATTTPCLESSPAVPREFDVFVPFLGLFTVWILLPIVGLPCLHLWLVRRAVSRFPPVHAETLARLFRPMWHHVVRLVLDQNYKVVFALWNAMLGPSRAATALTDRQLWELVKEVRIVRQPDRPLGLAVDHDPEACSILEPQGSEATLECCICLSPFQVVDGPIGSSGGTTTFER
jgi:hypothetical protein